MFHKKIALCILTLGCLLVCVASTVYAQPGLKRVVVYHPASKCKSTEIVSIQESTKRLALSCSSESIVEIISIENPTEPKTLHQFQVSSDEEISAIDLHPTENVFAVAIINNDPFAAGTIQIHDASTGELVNSLDAGVHPDGLVFSQNGKYLVVANEGEAYRHNGKKYESPEGSVTLVNYVSKTEAKATQIKLNDYSQIEGMLNNKHERKFERVVTGGDNEDEIKLRSMTTLPRILNLNL